MRERGLAMVKASARWFWPLRDAGRESASGPASAGDPEVRVPDRPSPSRMRLGFPVGPQWFLAIRCA